MPRRWLGDWPAVHRSAPPRREPARHRPNQFGRRLRFEPLEERRLLAVITVDTIDDEDDGIGIGGISLRDAITEANVAGTIEFDVAGTVSLVQGELFAAGLTSATVPYSTLHRATARARSARESN